MAPLSVGICAASMVDQSSLGVLRIRHSGVTNVLTWQEMDRSY